MLEDLLCRSLQHRRFEPCSPGQPNVSRSMQDGQDICISTDTRSHCHLHTRKSDESGNVGLPKQNCRYNTSTPTKRSQHTKRIWLERNRHCPSHSPINSPYLKTVGSDTDSTKQRALCPKSCNSEKPSFKARTLSLSLFIQHEIAMPASAHLLDIGCSGHKHNFLLGCLSRMVCRPSLGKLNGISSHVSHLFPATETQK